MERPDNILILEDNPADAELIQRQLRKSGIDFKAQWAQDKTAFIAALDTFAPDLILADYSVPGFDGMTALTMARQRFADIPVIIVSGAIGEEIAIDTLKAGATDYVLKSRLGRLGSVVTRALIEMRQLAAQRIAEQALWESQEKYRALIETSNSIIMTADQNLNVTFMNEFGLRFFGYTAKELIGRNVVGTTIPTDDEGRDLAAMAKDLTRHPHRYKTNIHRNMRKNGELVWVSWTNKPTYDAEGNLQEILAIGNDITDLKEAEERLRESEQRYRTLFDSIDEGFCTIKVLFDKNGKAVDYRFLEVNPAFEKQTGLRDVEGKTARQLIAASDEHWFETFGRIALTGQPARFETRVESLNRWYTVYASGVGEPEERKVAILFADITQRKESELERQRLLELLESKNKELQSVVYVASHDLRSPLLNIYGFSGQLVELWRDLRKIIDDAADIAEARQKTKDILDKDLPEYLNFIKAGAEKMQMVINGLLTISRLGTAQLNMERLDMNEIFEHIVKSIAFETKQKGAEIDVRPLPPCTGDRTQIHQLFSNIINNAIKYLDPNRPGRIHITGRQEGDMNIYSVCDNGIGIAKEHQEKIFEIFHRLNPSNGVSGEGLGLSIVLRIADRHNGKVWVDSTPGKGSAFHVALPA